MRCYRCMNFNSENVIEPGKEPEKDCFGTCMITGTVCKSNDDCINSCFEVQEQN